MAIFYYKLKFETPSIDVKTNILKKKLSWLDEESVNELGAKYPLNANQIDRIAMEAKMNEILEGKKPSKEIVEEYCKKTVNHGKKLSGGFLN